VKSHHFYGISANAVLISCNTVFPNKNRVFFVTEFRQISVFVVDGFECIFSVFFVLRELPLADDEVD
jgi:hypothetical protein